MACMGSLRLPGYEPIIPATTATGTRARTDTGKAFRGRLEEASVFPYSSKKAAGNNSRKENRFYQLVSELA